MINEFCKIVNNKAGPELCWIKQKYPYGFSGNGFWTSTMT